MCEAVVSPWFCRTCAWCARLHRLAWFQAYATPEQVRGSGLKPADKTLIA